MKNKITKKIFAVAPYFFLILFTLPKSIDSIKTLHTIANVLKAVSAISILIFFIYISIKKKKIELTKFSRIFIIYIVYLAIVTALGPAKTTEFVKTYMLNIAVILLVDMCIRSNNRTKVLRFMALYVFALIAANFSILILQISTTGKVVSDNNLLGLDNRIILYSLLDVVLLYALHNKFPRKAIYKYLLYISYTISLLTLILLWSVASFLIFIAIGAGYALNAFCKRFKFPTYTVFVILTVFCIALVFLNITHLFEGFIVNVLHKSPTLSFRTLMWDEIKTILIGDPAHTMFGFGFYNTSYVFSNPGYRVNHIHNIILDPLFASGMIGLALYFYMLVSIIEKIKKNPDIKVQNMLAIVFCALYLMLIFDTFERFQIYYMLLVFLYTFPPKIDSKQRKDTKRIQEHNAAQ